MFHSIWDTIFYIMPIYKSPIIKKLNLSKNKKFNTIFSKVYKMLNTNVEILTGACYITNENTKKKQEQSYEKMGMTLITDAKTALQLL